MRWAPSIGRLWAPGGFSTAAAYDVFKCPTCGALVSRDDTDKHEEWHDKLETILGLNRD